MTAKQEFIVTNTASNVTQGENSNLNVIGNLPVAPSDRTVQRFNAAVFGTQIPEGSKTGARMFSDEG